MAKTSPASGWQQVKASDRGATWRSRMKAPSQTRPKTAEFQPKPLSIQQENVIDLLIVGKSEREVAQTCGVDRGTIAEWRRTSPLFVATLNQRRQALWQEAQERLRALILKGLARLDSRVEDMSIKELLTLIGQHAHLAEPAGETDAGRVAMQMLGERLAAEGVSANSELSDLADILNPPSPKYVQRRAEILRELAGEEAEG